MFEKPIHRIDSLIFGGAIRRYSDRRRLSRRADKLADGLGYSMTTFYAKNVDDEIAVLCDLHGSDKGSVSAGSHAYDWHPHTFADLYSRLFRHCRQDVRKVFECGLGTNNPDLPSSMGARGKPGASLRVWRDYFPNAMVYGADIDRDILFSEERIKTFYVDQLDPRAITAFWSEVGEADFDLMIDDGLHTFEAGSTLFLHSIDRLSASGIYVIEDVTLADLLKFKSFFQGRDYVVEYVVLHRPDTLLGDNSMILVRRAACAGSTMP